MVQFHQKEKKKKKFLKFKKQKRNDSNNEKKKNNNSDDDDDDDESSNSNSSSEYSENNDDDDDDKKEINNENQFKDVSSDNLIRIAQTHIILESIESKIVNKYPENKIMINEKLYVKFKDEEEYPPYLYDINLSFCQAFRDVFYQEETWKFDEGGLYH